MPNVDATASTATTGSWKPLINSGRAKRGNDSATVELGGRGLGKWEVRLSVTIDGVADDPLTVYAGDSSIVALHFYNKTCRQVRLSGFKGQVVEESDGSELMDELRAYAVTPEAMDRLRAWLGLPVLRDEPVSS
jgi:hypothetical protein